jgi:phosphoglycolate phosphatase
MGRDTIFFDLDGTLTDPAVGIVRSFHYALERLGVEPPPDDALTACIGPPLLDSFTAFVGEARAWDGVRHYRERFADVGWKENAPYPGIGEVLSRIAASGSPLHVATSKAHIYAQRIVEHFGLACHFGRVFGAELDGTRARKADLLRFAVAETGAGERSIMVGDREHDVLGARANGLRAVGVTYGYGTRDELAGAGADVIVDAPHALPDVLLELTAWIAS